MNIHALLNHETLMVKIRRLLDKIVDQLESTALVRTWRNSLEGGLNSRKVQTSSTHQAMIHTRLGNVHHDLVKESVGKDRSACDKADFFFYSGYIVSTSTLYYMVCCVF